MNAIPEGNRAASTAADEYRTELNTRLDRLIATERQLAKAAAQRAEAIAALHTLSVAEAARAARSDPPRRATRSGWSNETRAHRELVTEIACALVLDENAAERLIAESIMLSTTFEASREALDTGRASYAHVQAILSQGRSVPVSALNQYESTILPLASTLTVPQLRHRARGYRERVHPESIEVRAKNAAEMRSVSVEGANDGMAHLTAYLPAVEAFGIYSRITALSTAARTPDDSRILSQRRADAFCDLLLNGWTESDGDPAQANGTAVEMQRQTTIGVRAQVLITVPALSLLNRGNEQARLEGYGPIPLAVAQELAAGSTGFTRILTHPESGSVLSVGRDRYSVPADLRRFLRLRDETCRFPGCRRSAANSDVDHTEEWQHGGKTNYNNLAHLCATHYQLKHNAEWSSTNSETGEVIWISPAGRRYITEPALVIEAQTFALDG